MEMGEGKGKHHQSRPSRIQKKKSRPSRRPTLISLTACIAASAWRTGLWRRHVAPYLVVEGKSFVIFSYLIRRKKRNHLSPIIFKKGITKSVVECRFVNWSVVWGCGQGSVRLPKSRFSSRHSRVTQSWSKNLYRDMCVFISFSCIAMYLFFFICTVSVQLLSMSDIKVHLSGCKLDALHLYPNGHVQEGQHGHFTATHPKFKCFDILTLFFIPRLEACVSYL